MTCTYGLQTTTRHEGRREATTYYGTQVRRHKGTQPERIAYQLTDLLTSPCTTSMLH
jgi:hypothetical protein